MFVSTNVLTVSKSGKPTFAAFGELKTLYEWQRDPRCLVSASDLRRNIFSGLNLEDSMQSVNRRVGHRSKAADTMAKRAA